MTDTERERINAICEVAGVKDIRDLSDGFHTFNGLYEQRAILFAALVKAYRDKAWKSYRHEYGEYCFGGGWFIVGIDTPEGSYTYHYENKYWDMFDCVDLPRAKHWDGHTEEDAETRLMSLEPAEPEKRTDKRTETHACDLIKRQDVIDTLSVGKKALSRVLNETDVVGTEREKFSFGLGLIESSIKDIEELPSAQPERTCVNCGRTANNGGWYADGGTRCPIEEHYALPKDGYCHLWEKRNVTDDDYPERRADE